MCCHNSLLEELSATCVTRLGEESWNPVPGFLWDSPHAPFFFAVFVLYPLAVINHSHENNYMLSPVSLPSESPKLGVALGTLDTSPCILSSNVTFSHSSHPRRITPLTVLSNPIHTTCIALT